jgi:hypothetical protein
VEKTEQLSPYTSEIIGRLSTKVERWVAETRKKRSGNPHPAVTVTDSLNPNR